MQIDVYGKLLEAVRLVALPFDLQVIALPEFVNHTDEIALIFDDSLRLFRDNQTGIPIATEAISLINQLDQKFAKMSLNKELWTLEALERDGIWSDCRNLAKLILTRLDEPGEYPNLDFISYVKGRTTLSNNNKE